MALPELRIVHAIQSVQPSSGGPTSAVLGLAEFQCRMGDGATIACAHGVTGSERVRVDMVAARVRPAAHDGLAAALGRRRPDVLHVHGVWDPIVRAATAAASADGIPWVLSSHGMLHPETLAHHAIRKFAYLAVCGRVVRSARHVLALNQEEAANVTARFGVPASVIPAGVDVPEQVPAPTGAFRRSVTGLGTAPFLLFIGRLDPIKGVDLLVDSFARACRRGLPHHLVIAGPEFGAQRAIEARVASEGLAPRVHLVGALWDDRKRDAVAECDLFVHRPRYEGYGLAAVEAMAAGKPVLTTVRCRLDAAAAAGAVCIAPDTTDGFADALFALSTDRGTLARQAASGRSWALRHAGWPCLGMQVRQVYAGVLDTAR